MAQDAGRTGDADFNPQVPCRTRPKAGLLLPQPGFISIHRSLAGPDAQDPEAAVAFAISIHRSLAGPDPLPGLCGPALLPFQSTGPLRDPTISFLEYGYFIFNFNPQVPCGTRQG